MISTQSYRQDYWHRIVLKRAIFWIKNAWWSWWWGGRTSSWWTQGPMGGKDQIQGVSKETKLNIILGSPCYLDNLLGITAKWNGMVSKWSCQRNGDFDFYWPMSNNDNWHNSSIVILWRTCQTTAKVKASIGNMQFSSWSLYFAKSWC